MKTSGVFFRAWLLCIAFVLSACAPLATATRAPETLLAPQPALPATFQTRYLNPLDTPRAYIQDTCQYLRHRWNPWNAEPGTVVVIIRFAEVYRGSGSADGVEVNELHDLMRQLQEQGFQVIKTKQALAFLERNVKIPPRSAVLIRDGNFPAADYNKYFRSDWEQLNWTIVNGWVGGEDVPAAFWQEHARLEAEGFVDHQAQGAYVGTYFTNDTSKVIINRELNNPIESFAKYFGKKPIAFIWQQGGFGIRPVQAARQLGYQLGFTHNPRGPVMFNWIPQADAQDPARPTLLPEGYIRDPLMTLPRYHPREALEELDAIRLIGNEAKEYAETHKAEEIDYYNRVCLPSYGPLPSP